MPQERKTEEGAMKAIVRGAARSVCRVLVQNPIGRFVVRRELARLAGEPWSAQLVSDFIEGGYGACYGVSADERRNLVRRFRQNTETIQSGTSPLVHLLLARAILSIPPDVAGDIIECGVWKGASTASLSIVCSRVGRRLVVCDSFEGLPDDGLKRHTGLHTGVYGHYQEGMFRGAEQEVRANVERCGAIEACTFVKGFFNESLRQLSSPISFAFLDVDLESSMRDCLRHIWPLLVDGGYVYTDDAGDLDVVKVFFDDPWWRETLGCRAPGFVGSGCGLPLNPAHSSIGYTRKLDHFDPAEWQRVSFLHYPDQTHEAGNAD